MSLTDKVIQYWYGTPGFLFRVFDILSIPFAIINRFVINLRNKHYNKPGISKKISCPVISIGNLNVGGVGKTPVTASLAGILNNNGFKVAICSRGYKGIGPFPKIVNPDDKWQSVGDEPLLLSRICKNTPVIVDRDRVRGSEFAIKQTNPDVIILDDGFQHRALFRNSDWLLIDSVRQFGNNKVFPRGPLREPVGSIKRCNLILATNYDPEKFHDPNQPLIKIRKYCSQRGFDRPLATGKAIPEYLTAISDWNDRKSFDILKNKPLALIAGIENPSRVMETLQDLQYSIVSKCIFPDHHAYTADDIKYSVQKAKSAGAEAFITTAKDAVKFEPLIEYTELPVWILHISFKIHSGNEDICMELSRVLGKGIRLDTP